MRLRHRRLLEGATAQTSYGADVHCALSRHKVVVTAQPLKHKYQSSLALRPLPLARSSPFPDLSASQDLPSACEIPHQADELFLRAGGLASYAKTRMPFWLFLLPDDNQLG